MIPRIAEGTDRDTLELGLLVARANALVPLKTISAPETFEVFAAAKQLLDRGVGTDLQRVSILYGLCTGNTLQARMATAFDLAHQIIEIAHRQDEPTYHVVGYRLLGTLQFYAGQNRAALASLEKGGKYRDPGRQTADQLSIWLGSELGDPLLRGAGAVVAWPARQRGADQRAEHSPNAAITPIRLR